MMHPPSPKAEFDPCGFPTPGVDLVLDWIAHRIAMGDRVTYCDDGTVVVQGTLFEAHRGPEA